MQNLNKIESIIKSHAVRHYNINKRMYGGLYGLEDIEQELWLHYLEKINEYDETKGTLENFFAKVFKNHLINFARANKDARLLDNFEYLSKKGESFYQQDNFNLLQYSRLEIEKLEGACSPSPIRIYKRVKFQPRFTGFLFEYVFFLVSRRFYLGIFEQSRQSIIDFIWDISENTKENIEMLVDYAIFNLRLGAQNAA